MAAESSKEASEDRVESLIDDLIYDILSEPSAAAEPSVRDAAALFERAFGPVKGARISTVERVVLAEAFASELAETLAPALAAQLAPRLLKALERLTTDEGAGRKPTSAARSGSEGRKPGAK